MRRGRERGTHPAITNPERQMIMANERHWRWRRRSAARPARWQRLCRNGCGRRCARLIAVRLAAAARAPHTCASAHLPIAPGERRAPRRFPPAGPQVKMRPSTCLVSLSAPRARLRPYCLRLKIAGAPFHSHRPLRSQNIVGINKTGPLTIPADNGRPRRRPDPDITNVCSDLFTCSPN